MSALKKLLKSDTPTGNAGEISGQGSHFPGRDSSSPDTPSYAQASETTGSTAPSTNPQTVGPPDVSSSVPPPAQAQYTTGPEAGGQEHVGTARPDQSQSTYSSSAQPTVVHASAQQTGASGSDLPTTLGSPGTGGVAAVGSTTTYSSQQLARGDPTSSIVDHSSTDPLTYRAPEHGASTSAGITGVPPDAAASAASKAWSSQGQGERMPGEFPTSEYENPYRASRLDPRVDGGAYEPQPSSAAAADVSSSSHVGRDAALGAGVGGAAALGASEAYGRQSAGSTGVATGSAPSTLTTTASPTDRSADYQQGASSKGTDNAQLAASTAYDNQSTEVPQTQTSIGAKVLGSLGAVAGTAAAAVGLSSGYDNSKPAPLKEAQEPAAGPPKHYRRESIPTTAYPSGTLDSPRAVAPPTGGIQPTTQSASEHSNLVRDAAVATGIGGGAVAAHEFTQGQQPHSGITGTTASTAAPSSGVGLAQSTSGVAPQEYNQSKNVRETIGAQPGTTVHDQITSPSTENHPGRDAAVVVGSSAALGAGAYGVHEHEKESHAGRDAALVGGTSAALGAGAYGVHEEGRTGHVAGGVSTQDTSVQPQSTGGASTAATNKYSDVPPTAAVAAAPGRYESQDYKQTDATTPAAAAVAETPNDRETHTARDAALGTATGAGVGAVAAHEVHDKDAERAQKAAEKEHRHAEKQAEKEHRHAEKQAEKEQKHAEKQAEKEHKQAEKDADREQKRHEKEVAAAEAAQDEERRKREKEAAAAAAGVGVGAGAAGAATYEAEKEREKEPEKKPNIFKRIFKRRKNKDTGEDEEYSTDEEERKGSGSGSGTGAADTESGAGVPHHHSESKGRNVLGPAISGGGTYEEISGGAQKPSYNPFRSNQGLDSDQKPVEPRTGLPYDPAKDPEAAARLSDPHNESVAGVSGGNISALAGGENLAHVHPGRGTDSAPLGDGKPGGSSV